MASNKGLYQLVYEIAILQFGVMLGVLMIIATKNGWNIFLDPPARLQPILSKVGRRLLPRKWEVVGYYIVGTLMIFVAGILILQRLFILAQRLGF
jgi:hypothetical protein